MLCCFLGLDEVTGFIRGWDGISGPPPKLVDVPEEVEEKWSQMSPHLS